MEKQNINDLINKAKANNQPKTIQKVTPIEIKENNEVQFSFYLSKTLLKHLKQKALNEEKSIKNIINKALEIHLKT
ncbi:hypothetical protein [Olleya namhaensis]|uniref:hypothetical protein n=1 Tax=Olleya namhaensis TaxID=1144750 RepID=UPI00232E0FC1|nr:hypothetical protein [Olleya namhaensis]